LLFDGFAIEKERSGIIFMANMTDKEQIIHVSGIKKSRTFFSLHEKNYSECCLAHPHNLSDNRQKHYSEQTQIMLMPYETRVLEYKRN
jgi:hypothetical protein